MPSKRNLVQASDCPYRSLECSLDGAAADAARRDQGAVDVEEKDGGAHGGQGS